jgi:hypothetical protein
MPPSSRLSVRWAHQVVREVDALAAKRVAEEIVSGGPLRLRL